MMREQSSGMGRFWTLIPTIVVGNRKLERQDIITDPGKGSKLIRGGNLWARLMSLLAMPQFT